MLVSGHGDRACFRALVGEDSKPITVSSALHTCLHGITVLVFASAAAADEDAQPATGDQRTVLVATGAAAPI